MEEKQGKLKLTKKKKIVLSIIGILLVVFIAANVYAAVNGYGNIFFMIKNLMETQEVSGSENLLSDKEITISYSSIDIADGLKIQINKMVIENNTATLYVYVDEENNKGSRTPLTYKVYNVNNTKLADCKGKAEEYEKIIDEIKIENFTDENATLKLDIYDNSNKWLVNITIDLAKKEIIVNGDALITKQSEVELKKYLGAFSLLNSEKIETKSDKALYVANYIQDSILHIDMKKSTQRETFNNIIETFYYENLEKEKSVIKTGKAWNYDKTNDAYIMMIDAAGEGLPSKGLCLDIEDISYKDKVYTIKFVYCLPSYQDEEKENIENIAQFEATAQITVNENAKYSKYKLQSLTQGNLIREAKNTNSDAKQLDINSELVQNLYKYILKVNSTSELLVYQNQKVTSSNLENITKLMTVFQNINDSEADRIQKEKLDYGEILEHYYFNTSTIKNKAKRIFGSDITFNHESFDDLRQRITVYYNNGVYDRSKILQGGGNFLWEQSNQYLEKAEEKGDEIYLYDKYVHILDHEDNYSISDIYNASDKKVKIAENIELSKEIKEIKDLPVSEYNQKFIEKIEKLTNKKLNTFKHTFKKNTDGTYYWVSTEILD